MSNKIMDQNSSVLRCGYEYQLKQNFQTDMKHINRRINFQLASKPSTAFNHAVSSTSRFKTEPSCSLQSEQKFSSKKQTFNINSIEKRLGLPADNESLCSGKLIWEFQSWSAVKRIGPGFYNLGNTCFLNSTLQCLAYIPALAQYLMGGLFFKSNPKRLSLGNVQGFNIILAIEKLFRKVHSNSGQFSISPEEIVKNIRVLGRQFHIGRQEDAHEFLCCLLDAMVKAELANAGIRGKESFKDKISETTAIHRIFGGYLLNQVKCPLCNYCSETYNSTLDLCLEVTGGVSTLNEAIKHFTSAEQLDKSNRWKCSKCLKSVCATKQLTIFKAPNVAIIQFKRFAFGKFGGKITRLISFPEELNLTLSGPEKRASYELAGVLVHVGGSMHGGHYFSYVRGSNKTWYHMDDSTVRQVSIHTVLQQPAYLLFYVRKTTPQFNELVQPSTKPPDQQQLASIKAEKAERTHSIAGSEAKTPAIFNKDDVGVVEHVPTKKPQVSLPVSKPNNDLTPIVLPRSLSLNNINIKSSPATETNQGLLKKSASYPPHPFSTSQGDSNEETGKCSSGALQSTLKLHASSTHCSGNKTALTMAPSSCVSLGKVETQLNRNKNTASSSKATAGGWTSVLKEIGVKQKQLDLELGVTSHLNNTNKDGEDKLANPTGLAQFVSCWRAQNEEKGKDHVQAPNFSNGRRGWWGGSIEWCKERDAEKQDQLIGKSKNLAVLANHSNSNDPKASSTRKRKLFLAFTGIVGKLHRQSCWRSHKLQSLQTLPCTSISNKQSRFSLEQEGDASRVKKRKRMKEASADSKKSSLEVPLNTDIHSPPRDEKLSQPKASAPQQMATVKGKDARVEVTGKSPLRPFVPPRISKSAMIYGAEVGTWEDDDTETSAKIADMKAKQMKSLSTLLAQERETKKQRQLDSWDRMLDTGKIKKVKSKSDNSCNGVFPNPFQRVSDAKSKFKKQYRNSDTR